MVYEAWLKTQNNFQLKAWVDNRDREHVSCKLQMSDLKYSICDSTPYIKTLVSKNIQVCQVLDWASIFDMFK